MLTNTLSLPESKLLPWNEQFHSGPVEVDWGKINVARKMPIPRSKTFEVKFKCGCCTRYSFAGRTVCDHTTLKCNMENGCFYDEAVTSKALDLRDTTYGSNTGGQTGPIDGNGTKFGWVEGVSK